MTDTAERRDCPTCGMPRDLWPDDSAGGYRSDTDYHCCKGCAEGAGCTCKGNRTVETHALLNEHLQDNPGVPDDPAAAARQAQAGPTSPTDR